MGIDGIAVLIPYFNPVGYRSHPRKLARSLEAFRRVGLAEHVYLTGAGALPPLDANIAFWDEECPFLWHKERLINVAARRLPDRYTHIVWADSDVIVGRDWAEAVADAFTEAPVVQAFSTAHYRTPDGIPTRSRPSALRPGSRGAIGLAWGAAREFFTEGPGLFAHALVGGGDSVFGCSMLDYTPMPSVPYLRNYRAGLDHVWSPALLGYADTWLATARHWLDGRRPVAADADIDVLEHGTVQQRQYHDRHTLLTALDPAQHLFDAPGHIFRWTDPGLAHLEPAIRAYFHSRAEDEEDTPVPAAEEPAA